MLDTLDLLKTSGRICREISTRCEENGNRLVRLQQELVEWEKTFADDGDLGELSMTSKVTERLEGDLKEATDAKLALQLLSEGTLKPRISFLTISLAESEQEKERLKEELSKLRSNAQSAPQREESSVSRNPRAGSADSSLDEDILIAACDLTPPPPLAEPSLEGVAPSSDGSEFEDLLLQLKPPTRSSPKSYSGIDTDNPALPDTETFRDLPTASVSIPDPKVEVEGYSPNPKTNPMDDDLDSLLSDLAIPKTSPKSGTGAPTSVSPKSETQIPAAGPKADKDDLDNLLSVAPPPPRGSPKSVESKSDVEGDRSEIASGAVGDSNMREDEEADDLSIVVPWAKGKQKQKAPPAATETISIVCSSDSGESKSFYLNVDAEFVDVTNQITVAFGRKATFAYDCGFRVVCVETDADYRAFIAHCRRWFGPGVPMSMNVVLSKMPEKTWMDSN